MSRLRILPLILPLLLILDCQRREFNKLVPATIADASKIGMRAVDEAFTLSNDSRVVRYIAVSAATLLAREAAGTMLMSQADRFDRLFGTDQAKEVCSMLLAGYVYPILDDIVTTSIDRRLRRLDPAFRGDTAGPDVDSMISSYVTRFNLDNAFEIVEGTGILETATDSVAGLFMVNSATYAFTRNWKDVGRTYQYRIENGKLEMKCGDKPWEQLPLPNGRIPRIIAADNNRCFVLTDNRELWWYCAKQDQAQWSIDIMKSSVELMALKPAIGEQVCEQIMPLLARVIDSAAIKASTHQWLGSWRDSIDSHTYWSDKCRIQTQVAMNVEELLLKTGDGRSFTAQDYTNWSNNAHREGVWSNLLTWRSGDSTYHRGSNLPVDSIVDIAVGNWNGTVVTMYALALGKIWFIDEEVIHPEWKAIENWNAQWAVIAREYHPIENSPYPLDSTCRIDASNSVVAVSRRSGDTSLIYWLRWDYHQKDDFVYWPLDWCEHACYAVICPPRTTDDFRISTMGNSDPRRNNTVWSVPAPYFTFHTYLPREGYQGIFGDIQREQVSAYPVDLFVTDTAGAVRRFSIDTAEKVRERVVEWKTE